MAVSQTKKLKVDSDRGFKSRKLWYAIGTSCLIFFCGLVSAYIAAFRPSLEIVVGGLVATFTVYAGGNITNKVLMARSEFSYDRSAFSRVPRYAERGERLEQPIEPEQEE